MTGKKKKRAAKRVASKHRDDKVEALVAKAAARVEVAQAVKNAILEIHVFLLDGVQDKSQLQATSRLLTQSEYSDVVMERSVSKQCGYPLCHNGLISEPSRKVRYKISLHEHRVYDLSETRLFCCANCLVASKTFQSSLHIERDEFMKKERLMSIIDHIRGPQASKLHHSNGNLKDPENQSVALHKSSVSRIQEGESGISSFDDTGPFDGFEGCGPHSWPPKKMARQSESANIDQLELGAALQRMATGDDLILRMSPASEPVSLDKDKSPLILDKLDEEISPEPLLKSVLKKGTTQKILKRKVSWEDQKDPRPERKPQRSSSPLKERSEVHTSISQSSPTSIDSDVPTSKETVIAGDSVSFSSDVDKMEVSRDADETKPSSNSLSRSRSTDPVDNPEFPAEGSETHKPERTLSAEEVVAALTQIAEAAAGGAIGSEEAVARAGLSIVPVAEEDVESVTSHQCVSSLNDLEKQAASDY